MPDAGPTSERLEDLRARWESDKSSRVFLQLADEYRRLGRAEDAVRVLEEGLAENPRYPAARVALGRCQLELGRTEEAAGTLERVIENDPTQMVAYRLLVDAYVAQGKPEEARQRLRVYSLLNDADPDIAELRRQIGQLERQERPDPAPATPAPPAPEDLLAEPAEGPGTDAGASEPSSSLEEIADFEAFSEAPFGSLEVPEPPPSAELPPEPAADPFPDLAAPPDGWHAAPPGDDLFELAPAEPARPEPPEESPVPLAAAGAAEAPSAPADPFDLGPPAPPPPPDLSSLLGSASAATAAAPEEVREPAPPPLETVETPPEDETDITEVTEPAEPGAEPLPASVSEAGRPTVTLGLLYLRQGHTREAEEIFRAVLERDPDNAEALQHLEEIGEQLRAELGEPRRLTAADLLEGWQGDPREVGTTRRKRHVLERYRDHILGRARRDVH